MNLDTIYEIAERLEDAERDLCYRYMALNPEDHQRERDRDYIIEGIRKLMTAIAAEERKNA